MNKPRIIFRADGNSQIGLGHVIRSLALADMIKDDFDCSFIIRNPLQTLKDQILKTCKQLIILDDPEDNISEAETIVNTKIKSDDIVVLDGYHFNTAYQQVIKNKGCKLICIDDIHSHHFVADVVINHAGGMQHNDYSISNKTELHLGLSYALLRKPFIEIAKSKVDISIREEAIFICLGGADPNNDTLGIIKQCEKIKGIEKIYIILGGAYMHHEELMSNIEHLTVPLEILSNLDDQQMVHYMSKCKMAIVPPSTISYEYLSVGGLLFLKVIADNQKGIIKYFLDEGVALDFEIQFDQVSTIDKINSLLPSTISKQKKYLDGNQPKRFKAIFNYLCLNSRKATLKDCKKYYDWANDPKTRLQSYNSDVIPYDSHEKWFSSRIDDKNSRLYIISLFNEDIGQIRFQLQKNEATISYSLDQNHRGKRLSNLLLKKGIELIKEEFDDSLKIIGFVKNDNIASLKAFRNLNFSESKALEVENSMKFEI